MKKDLTLDNYHIEWFDFTDRESMHSVFVCTSMFSLPCFFKLAAVWVD